MGRPTSYPVVPLPTGVYQTRVLKIRELYTTRTRDHFNEESQNIKHHERANKFSRFYF